MTDFLCVILTSDSCGHCAFSRGNGLLGNGKEYMKYDILKSLLSPYSDERKIVILNIHYSNMSGRNSLITDISKIYIKEDSIFQEKYFNFSGKTKVKNLSSLKDKIKNISEEDVAFNNQPMDWSTFIEKRVPKKLENYTYYYPCFLAIAKKNWEVSINQNTELTAIANAGRTIINSKGGIELEKNPQTIGKFNMSPNQLIKGIFEKKIKIEPHNQNDEKEVKNIQDTKFPTPVITKKEPQISCKGLGFIIKSFEN